ncbi:polyamine aminopropyltransferase [Rhodovulum sp. DZ06]|uniref:polyamine aminopropyltransferase n=1 Tax=Rhodovulum sp. DZ06 TaxID=3425126 RepID=UPI003D33BB82
MTGGPAGAAGGPGADGPGQGADGPGQGGDAARGAAEGTGAPTPGAPKAAELWLLAAAFFIAAAGLTYELIAAASASYLIGDSIAQFSLVIGVFLSSMGLGAWASRHVSDPARGFVSAQLALGVLGGFSAPALFFSYAYLDAVRPVLFTALIAIGALAGAEIPLIARLLEKSGARHRFENVLTFDYAGALAASVLFPLAVVPMLGLMAASLAFGLMNVAVGAASIVALRPRGTRGLAVGAAVSAALLVGGLGLSDRFVSALDAQMFEDEVILAEDTAHQRVVVTRFRDRTRLFLNGSIQFDSLDEHRYHEALVHPAMSRAASRKRVLILGGGDGMAAREVLRWPEVEAVVLVDLDPRVTEIFAARDDLAALNGGSLRNPRLTVVNQDAWAFAQESGEGFDVIIGDLPDPRTHILSKLYSLEFYAILMERLRPGGVFTTQAGSPVFAREAFWCVAETLAQTRNPYAPEGALSVLPYHVYTPSFGDWGFVMASPRARPPLGALPDGLKFLTPGVWAGAAAFGKDAGPVEVPANSIKDHPLVRYYENGWDRWFR